MRLETNPTRVRELAKQREDENWRFRAFLKGVDLPSGELDAVVHRHYEAVSNQIDCLACGNCCRKARPTLSRADAQRLAAGLNASEDEVVGQYLQPGQHEGTFLFASTPCPFLSTNRCSVYDSRPHDCRSYPHLHKEEFVSRLIQAVSHCSICPIVFNVFECLKDELWLGDPGVWMDVWDH